jgi:hypothetical protein
MRDDNPIKKLAILKPDGCRIVGRPNAEMDGWMEQAVGQEGMEKYLGSGKGQNWAVNEFISIDGK